MNIIDILHKLLNKKIYNEVKSLEILESGNFIPTKFYTYILFYSVKTH